MQRPISTRRPARPPRAGWPVQRQGGGWAARAGGRGRRGAGRIHLGASCGGHEPAHQAVMGAGCEPAWAAAV